MADKFNEKIKVLSQVELQDGIFSMWIQSENMSQAAKPGQFVSIYSNSSEKMLPRPISICEIDREICGLRLVYRVTGEHTGTEEFSKAVTGDTFDAIGPLGNGFPTDGLKGKKAILVGGGIGIPPMVALGKKLNSEKEIVVGYRDSNMFLKEELEFAATAKGKGSGGVIIATEDGSVGTKGNVMDAIREHQLTGDVIFACGPTPMLRALKAYAEENHITCYISLEEKMACGIGACLACVCQTKDKDEHSNVNNKRICKDGPVFLSTEVEL